VKAGFVTNQESTPNPESQVAGISLAGGTAGQLPADGGCHLDRGVGVDPLAELDFFDGSECGSGLVGSSPAVNPLVELN